MYFYFQHFLEFSILNKLQIKNINLLYCRHDLNYFSGCHFDAVSFVDPDQGNGELNIKIPQDAMYLVNGEYYELKAYLVILSGGCSQSVL